VHNHTEQQEHTLGVNQLPYKAMEIQNATCQASFSLAKTRILLDCEKAPKLEFCLIMKKFQSFLR
jgi:hypothetical protein